MHIKRMLAVLLCAAALMLPMAGCNNTPANSTSGSNGGGQQQQQQQPSVPEPKPPVTVSVTEGGKTEARSYETLAEAVPKIKKKIADSASKVSVKVSIAEGTYTVSETAEFTGSGIEDKDYEIEIAGAGKDKTILTGAVEADNSEIIDMGDGVYGYTIPDEYLSEDGEYPAIRDLLLDGERLTVARSASGVFAANAVKYKTDENGNATTELVDREDEILLVDPALLDGIDNDSIGNLELWLKGSNWYSQGLRIEAIEDIVTYNGRNYVPLQLYHTDWEYLVRTGASGTGWWTNLKDYPYWLANNYEFLTENNTFVYDRAEGTFYFKTDKSPDEFTIAFPTVNNFINFEDMKNVTVKDIGFTSNASFCMMERGWVMGGQGNQTLPNGTASMNPNPEAAIFGNNVDKITIDGCSFTQMAYDGVQFIGKIKDVTIQNNTFEHISAGAIIMGVSAMYSPFYYCQGITITNNLVEYTGEIYFQRPAMALFGSARDAKITYNTVRHVSYIGIDMGRAIRPQLDEITVIYNAEIAYNFVEDFMLELQDGGAIYVHGNNASMSWTDYFNIMHDNFVIATEKTAYLEETDKLTGAFCMYYCDDHSSNWDVYNNVGLVEGGNYAGMGMVYFQYGAAVSGADTQNLRARDNYLIDAEEHDIIRPAALQNAEEFNRIAENNHRATSVSDLETRYPQAAEVVKKAGCTGSKGAFPQA